MGSTWWTGTPTVRSRSRPLLISALLTSPNLTAGSFVGTVVEHNTLNSLSSMIKIGIAIGGMSWGSDNRTVARTFGGIVRNNHFQSGPTDAGFFGFAIALAGHEGAMVTGNRASQASFGGLPTRFCIPNVLPPSPRAFVYDQWTTPGRTVQAEFWNAPLVFLICESALSFPCPLAELRRADSPVLYLSRAKARNRVL